MNTHNKVVSAALAAILLLSGATGVAQPTDADREQHAGCSMETIAAEYVQACAANGSMSIVTECHTRERALEALLWLFQKSKAVQFAGPPEDLEVYPAGGPCEVLSRWYGSYGMIFELGRMKCPGLEHEMEEIVQKEPGGDPSCPAIHYLAHLQSEEAEASLRRLAMMLGPDDNLHLLIQEISYARAPTQRWLEILTTIRSRQFADPATAVQVRAALDRAEGRLRESTRLWEAEHRHLFADTIPDGADKTAENNSPLHPQPPYNAAFNGHSIGPDDVSERSRFDVTRSAWILASSLVAALVCFLWWRRRCGTCQRQRDTRDRQI